MNSNLKQRILSTASNLFYTQGINATGIDAIVKAAGTTKMSLYKYFPSKDDLVLAHLQQSADEMRQRVGAISENRALAPHARMMAVFDLFDEILTSADFGGCPLINASAEFARGNDPVKQVAATFYRDLLDTLDVIAMQAQIRRSSELAEQLVLLIAGAIVTSQMQKNSGALRQARAAAETLINQAAAR